MERTIQVNTICRVFALSMGLVLAVALAMVASGQAYASVENRQTATAEGSILVGSCGGASPASASEAPNTSAGMTAGFTEDEGWVFQQAAEGAEKSVGLDDADFILPESDKRVYSSSELAGLSDDELFLARNELFARHGAAFGNVELSEYFGGKAWYRDIKPKIESYGSEILNIAESTNAATLRRIELSRGSSRVNPLEVDRAEMYALYLAKAEKYIQEFGECGEEHQDAHTGLKGACLVQLVDFEKDGWEELLIAYHDGSHMPKGECFGSKAYTIEVWSYESKRLTGAGRQDATASNAHCAHVLISEIDGSRELSSGDTSGRAMMYHYRLSAPDEGVMGEFYWDGSADISFGLDQVKTITDETLATLRIGKDSTINDNRTEKRDEVAKAFAMALQTNYSIENGEYVGVQRDYQRYVSPTSELYEWKDGNDEGEDILVLGNPCRTKSVEVADVVGDLYFLDLVTCWPVNSEMDEEEKQSTMVVVLNDDDLVEHAYWI